MGVAQCEPQRHWTRLLYVAVFGLVIVHRELPWIGIAAALFGA